jgi:hypothetical protein
MKMNIKRKAIVLATLIVIILALTACDIGAVTTVNGSGNVVEENREVSGITGVQLATIGDLIIEVGDRQTLRIEAEDNLMAHIESDVRGGKLRISTENNVRLDPTEPVKYYLTVTELEDIEISSVGNIEAPDLEGGEFSIKISSTGDLDLGELNADSLEVDISSTGDVDIAGGVVNSQDINLSSTGKYTAQDLASDEADVRLSSTGSATIWVRDQLKANLSSTGDLRYRGNPTVDASTSSTGNVIPIAE